MNKIMITLALVIALFLVKSNVVAAEKIIPHEAIRLRVIANSNSPYDQYIKSKVRKEIQTEVYYLLDGIKSISEASNIIKTNINTLDSVVKNVFIEESYSKPYKLVYGNNYFPTKEYKGITYEEGYYKSLLVTLGEGKGDNWWCVLFPPLCLIEAEEASEVEYKFFIKEIINKFLK